MNKYPKLFENLIAWIDANNIKTAGGEKFEWFDHRFMIDPMIDSHPDQGINKCAQVGFSESMIVKTIYMAKRLGLNIGYTLDSSKAMENFNRAKFGAIVEANELFRNSIEGTSTEKVISFGNKKRFVHLVGAYNPESMSKKEITSKGISFTADALVHDEASRSDQYVLDQLRSRILNSKYKFRWLFDNPSYPGMGADAVYRDSDQMHWIVKCPHCGYRQYLDWFKLDEFTFKKNTFHCWVDPVKAELICGKCMKVLDNEVRRTGEWIAKYSNKTNYRGYWINQLCYIHHSIPDILKEEKEMSKSVFSNMVMGKPYIGSDVVISREAIAKNIIKRPVEPRKGYVAMGVDQGNEKQYVLGDENGIFAYGRTKSWDDIIRLRDQYDATIVMDAEPEDVPVNICKKYEGKAWRAYFKNENFMNQLTEFGDKAHNKDIVYIKKHMMFDELSFLINNGQFPINININDLHEYISEWSDFVRTTKEDSTGNMRPEWVKVSPHVDFPFATLYFWVALSKATGHTLVSKMKTKGNEVTSNNLNDTADDLIRRFTKNLK